MRGSLRSVVSNQIKVKKIDVPGQPKVPKLAHKLDRVLFNPGVHVLKDTRTNVYNFTPNLEKIMPVTEFDFTMVAPFVRPDKDTALARIASENKAEFTGSTSSLTSLLSQLHFALSNFRPPQIMSLPKYFPENTTTFSATQRMPTAARLVYNRKSGTHAVANFSSNEIILSLLGHNLETMLTTEADEFKLFNKNRNLDGQKNAPSSKNSTAAEADKSHSPASAQHVEKPQASTLSHVYSYTQIGSLLMRSQLDCYDPRLPGTGTFDLKTRACCAVRYDIDYAQIRNGSDYRIHKLHGEYESYSREYYELIRSAMFKYSLQARIGRMDGIFVAYHNVRRMFGFQYIPLTEIDKIYHTAQLVLPDKEEEASDSKGKQRKNSKSSARGVETGTDLEVEIDRIATYTAESEYKLSVTILQMIFRQVLARCAEDDCYFTMYADGPSTLLVFCDECPNETEDKIEELNINKSSSQNEKGTTGGKVSMLSPQYEPRALKGFRLNFTQKINGTLVHPSQYPSVASSEDVWTVDPTIEDLDAASVNDLFDQVRSKYHQQKLVSSPRTEEIDEEEAMRLLELLPVASNKQKILRRLGEIGAEYQKWDDERKKHFI
ncbi:Pet127 protein [Starmerella bacillaris]|uniref:Pet127 protein n=1 Tax=Starmerella bacillaris TaxID=1247836 RepID=A0AAV5RG55_STABA|nr:Pet127 protein [Starmerella bacillaris]